MLFLLVGSAEGWAVGVGRTGGVVGEANGVDVGGDDIGEEPAQWSAVLPLNIDH